MCSGTGDSCSALVLTTFPITPHVPFSHYLSCQYCEDMLRTLRPCGFFLGGVLLSKEKPYSFVDFAFSRCPVGEDFWFVGSRCNERRTKQSVSLTGVVLGAIFAVIAMATVIVTTLLLRARQRRHRHSSRAGDEECAESR